MPRYIAVIDLGKTNSKVALVDSDRAEEIRVLRQTAAVNTQTPYPSLDHQAIEAFILSSLSALSREHPVEAITVTTHGATVALLNHRGELALPVLDYEYKEVDSIREAYNTHRASFTTTGSPTLPGGLNVGAQLYWLQKTYAEKFSTVQTILTWPQYWVYRLTGELHNDVTSLGCHTDLYEPEQRRYSSLVERMGWTHLMPPTQLPGQFAGNLKKNLAQQLGLPPTIAVHTGIHDSNASLVPHLINHSAPFSVVSTGTWFISMSIGGPHVELDEERDTLLNVNATGQCVPSARFMGGRERELLATSTQISEHAISRLFDCNLSTLPMLMPSTVSGCGPYPNTQARWIGPSVESKTLRSCAATLYLALMTHECMQLIGSCGPTFVEGPLAHDALYTQMLNAVSKRPVMIGSAETGTSVGAAMLVKAPIKPPSYKRVASDWPRQKQLHDYALRWRYQLQCHAM